MSEDDGIAKMRNMLLPHYRHPFGLLFFSSPTVTCFAVRADLHFCAMNPLHQRRITALEVSHILSLDVLDSDTYLIYSISGGEEA